ncbi:MAG: TIM barrel protein [Vicinamibacterales bacterium]
MEERDLHERMFSRRHFGKLALAVPAAGLMARTGVALAFQGQPNSVWGGVPFGVFAPYRFGPEATDLDGALKALVRLGVSQTEISAAPVERFCGAPQAAPAAAPAATAAPAPAAAPAPSVAPAPGAIPCVNGVPSPGGRGAGGGGGGGGRGAPSPEQQAAARAQAEALLTWRTSVPMRKFTEVKQKFSNAGVMIYAYRITLTAAMSEAEYDYAFNAAKALGATQLTMEKPADLTLSKRIGDAADRHQVNVGYHLHTTASMTAWDDVIAQSPRNGLQLDIGHYVAGTGESPVPLIEKLHDRIFSMHLKDRKRVCHDASENMPWGQGDTPIKAVLQTLKKNRWAIPVGIEFEYLVPSGSTWEREIAKCIQYGKDALLG